MDCLSKCGRILIVVLNIIFLLIGLVIFGVGMVLKFGFEKIKPYLDDILVAVKQGIKELTTSSSSLGSNVQLPSNVNLENLDELVEIIENILKDVAVVLIVLGTVMLVIVLLGLCGACYKIKIFLYGYSIIIFVMLVAMVTVAGLYLNRRDIIDDKVKPILKKAITDSYGGLKGTDFTSLAWNFGMQQFSCCGVDSGYDFKNCTNWDNHPFATLTFKTPLTCCKTLPTRQTAPALDCAINPVPNNSNSETGCYDVLWSYVEEYNKYVMTTVIIVSIIQALLIFLACWIACKEGSSKVGHMDS